jgi:hypothetical protein
VTETRVVPYGSAVEAAHSLARLLAAGYLRLLASRIETAPSHRDDQARQIRVDSARDKSVNVLENSGEPSA